MIDDPEAERLRQVPGSSVPSHHVCRAFLESGDHPHVARIYGIAAKIDPGICVGPVYRAMNALEQAGVVRLRRFGERRVRYESAAHEHHHLIDTRSGQVTEFESERITALGLRIAHELGDSFTSLRIELYGVPIRHLTAVTATTTMPASTSRTSAT